MGTADMRRDRGRAPLECVAPVHPAGARMSREPLPDELVELIAERFRLIGEPVRIRLLDRLTAGDRSVGELAAELGATQQNVSKHLATLHRAGLLTRRKEGNRVLYSVADPTVLALCATVCDGLRTQVSELARIVGAAGS